MIWNWVERGLVLLTWGSLVLSTTSRGVYATETDRNTSASASTPGWHERIGRMSREECQVLVKPVQINKMYNYR